MMGTRCLSNRTKGNPPKQKISGGRLCTQARRVTPLASSGGREKSSTWFGMSQESIRCGSRLQSRNLILGGGGAWGLGRALYQKPRSGWCERGLDVKEPACYRPSAPRCKYDDKSGPVFCVVRHARWDMARKSSSRGSFWDRGLETATAVCLTCHTAHQPVAPDGRDRVCRGTPGEEGRWDSWVFSCTLRMCCVTTWLIDGHEIDEVHPSQSETVGSGLKGAHWRRWSDTAGDGADLTLLPCCLSGQRGQEAK